MGKMIGSCKHKTYILDLLFSESNRALERGSFDRGAVHSLYCIVSLNDSSALVRIFAAYTVLCRAPGSSTARSIRLGYPPACDVGRVYVK